MKKRTTTLFLFAAVCMGGFGAAEAQDRTLELEASAAQLNASVLRVNATLAGIQGRLMYLQTSQDSVEAMYRAARRTLNGRAYMEAARAFRSIYRNYPRHSYASAAMYWDAFARYSTKSTEELGEARRVIRALSRAYPDASEMAEAERLAVRIDGELARRGDATAAQNVTALAAPPSPDARVRPPRPPRPPRPQQHEDDIRMAALNALMQMDAERAVPILKQVLENHEGSPELRTKAVFVISQHRSDETSDILLGVVRNDPDAEVRAQAVFWLSQVPGPRTVAALDSILSESDDLAIQEKAIFALSQHRAEEAAAALRDYVRRSDGSEELRSNAIFWLGQHRSSENQAFLRDIYTSLESTELKERVLFSVSQNNAEGNGEWLVAIAMDQAESIELRKKALFWAGQTKRLDIAQLDELYDTMDDEEMRAQIIFVTSQRREPAAVDLLMKIAENDPNEEMRSKAVFWLGQSKDPRVAEFLLRLIINPDA